MKKLDHAALCQVDTWMARNARPLEWALWRLHFQGGSREDVLAALGTYQNADGGFGHALEPDNWNPNSAPYFTLFAVNLLRGIGFEDASHPLLSGALRFFEQTEHRSDFGWHFNIASSNDHAHAPWWGYHDGPSAVESLGLTAGIAGYALTHTAKGSALYDMALGYAELAIHAFQTPGKYGDMGVGGGVALLRDIEVAGLGERLGADALRLRLTELVNGTIERDVEKWQYYGVRPSNYITGPDNPWLKGNEDIMQAELDYLVDTRPDGGVWGLTWSWFDNNERYAREWAISENWWRAIAGIDKVHLLKAFGRIEE